MIREPIVSGKFYPAKEKDLRQFIEGVTTVKETSKVCAKGVILPHAGYIYSGKVAATTLSKIMPAKKVIILGNNHTGYGRDFALWAKGSWKTPLGEIKIEENLAKKILDSGDTIEEDYLAHKIEHSIEVELPLLSYFFKEFEFVPIACMAAKIETYEKCSDQICRAVKTLKEEVLFIASTDMTHYEPDQAARKKDRLALEHIINRDARELIKTVKKENITMCGIAPVAILLLCMQNLGATKANVALYQTSGDASGDNSSVVGYAGVIIQ